jgi:subtilisin family serine protease
MRKIYRNVFVCLVLILSVPVTGASPDPSFWGGTVSVESLKGVPQSIITRMENDGIAEFFIVLADQADLSGATQLARKEDRGAYVFNQLRAVADRTQPQVIADLGLHRSDIQRFHIQNMILVKDGSPDMLLGAVNHVMVSAIRENRPYEFTNEQPMAYDANEPARAPEWNLTHIGITDVWAEGITGEGIVVANLDTGVDWDHPALKNKYRGWNGSTADHDYNWHDVSSSPSSVPYDSGSHGTHTMGTMVGDDGAGNQVGGAPGAKWMACGPLNDDAGFHECFEWFLAPYRFGENPSQGVPEMAPHVVNNSWGWPIGGGDYQYAPDLDALQAAGVFMEFSAGNEGDSCESLRSPGDYPQVLSTGASDVEDRIVSTSWTYWGSSRGPASSGIPGAPDFIKPEIVAPGYDVRSCVPGTGYEGGWGGTSMAGPHTCAVVALMWSAAPSLIGDIATTRQIIIDNAYTQAGGAGYWNQTCEGINAATTIPNHVWGWGLLDAYACYQALAGIYLDREVYQPDDVMVINVRDSAAAGSVTVQVKSTVETSWEYVTLPQIGDGMFEAVFNTISGPPVHGDGAVSVVHGASVTVWYPDLDMTTSASIDGVLPVISNVSVASVKSRSFTATWQTDEPARSIVLYGTGSPGEEVRDEEFKTDHSLTVTGLEPCTYYYFDVMAEDKAGNTALDDNGGAHYGVQTYEVTIYLDADMDTDPGWTYEPDWAWGQPTGQGGQYGSPDPNSGYTGTNVVGYNLNGDYANNMSTTKWATTQAFNCSEASVVNLEFYAWLGVEQSIYDRAFIAVSNNNGGSWTTIWENDETLEGGSWELWTFDISSVAAGYSQVKIRWGMGPTDSGWRYCGWNIDDVMVSFETPCEEPTPTPNLCIHDGDVDMNGVISAGDAQMAFQIALGMIIPTYEEECAADCNGNGVVSAGDAQQIFLTALGADTCVDPL